MMRERALDLTTYRDGNQERQRTADLIRLIPPQGDSALDIGARDGHFARILTQTHQSVTALDLSKPTIAHERITCVAGDIVALPFADRSFDLIFCAEVLEHIGRPALFRACAEIARVSSDFLVIGVPYRQDVRIGRTTCAGCGARNPPWGHVNSFDQTSLARLFPEFTLCQHSFVGTNQARTNFLSARLLDFAGNPFGTYEQEEPCGRCGKPLGGPGERSAGQKIATRLAVQLTKLQSSLSRRHGNWIHLLYRKRA